jgi:hypothetical protein
MAADGNKVSSTIDLVQAIKTAEDTDRGLVLQIMRKHRLQELTLTW